MLSWCRSFVLDPPLLCSQLGVRTSVSRIFMPELDFQSFVSSCSIVKYHLMALVSITLPSFGQTEWMLSPTFVSSLSMDRGPFTKLMQPEACCQKVPPSVTIWKKHQAFMPGHESFCISEPSLIKLLHFEGWGFASVSDKNPKFLMRTVISWSRGARCRSVRDGWG